MILSEKFFVASEASGRNTVQNMFSQLDLLISSTPLEGPEQMALDDLLLSQASRPLLRLYSWKAPCVTFGYFQKWHYVHAAFPRHPLVRRASGGGMVEHDGDITFSLIIPASEPAGKMAPSCFYQKFHEILVKVLQEFGVHARLSASHECKRGESCFQSPSPHDVVLENHKIAGGAQRRCAGHLLHQGSLTLIGRSKIKDGKYKKISREEQSMMAKPLFSSIAEQLSTKVTLLEEQSAWFEKTSKIAMQRYRTITWNQKK